jgi:hypothetical protein
MFVFVKWFERRHGRLPLPAKAGSLRRPISMIDTGRVAALLTLIQRLPAEERQMIADQLQAIQRAQAAGFQAIDPAHRQVIPTAAEVRARLERAQGERG